MSVIFGVNLSDRVYIAGDSRISDLVMENGVEYVVPKSDNILKVDLIKGDGGCALACAGDAKFASFLLKDFFRQEFSKGGIISIRSGIEEWAKKKTHNYFSKNTYTSANFLFAGSDKENKKIIPAKRIFTLAKSYLKEGQQGVIKPHLATALERHADMNDDRTNGDFALDINNTSLFAVKINKNGIEIIDTVFGEFLLFGPEGLVKEDLRERYIGQLEFSSSAGEISHDIGLIIVVLDDLAKNKQLDSVGGCVVPIGAFSDGNAYFTDGDLNKINTKTGVLEVVNRFRVRGGTFYRVDQRGTWYKMTKVVDYQGTGKGMLFL
jgi:hypothetical protein